MARAPDDQLRVCDDRLAASERPATPSSPMPTIDSHRPGVQFPLAIKFDELGAEHMRVLILGGTTEASELARLIAGDNLTSDRRFDAILSLAGRTINPKALPLATRVADGGVDGLAQWLVAERVEAVIDATHPYAPNISRNAVAACRQAGVPLGSLGRPAWPKQTGDRWIDVPDAIAAARALGEATARVFLSLGRLEIGAFASAPSTITSPVRSIPRGSALAARYPLHLRTRTIRRSRRARAA